MLALADVAQDVGGDIRLTRQQNFIVGNVPDDRVGELVQRVERIGFSLKTSRLYGRAIGCTGEPFCNYSVSKTKEKLQEILRVLDERFGDRVSKLKIHLDGCPHACAQHFIGDINLTGTTVRLGGGKTMEGYDILLRGGIGADAAIARPVFRRVRTDEVIDHLQRLITAWLEAQDAQEDLSFRRFCDERSDEQLVAIGTGGAAATPTSTASE
jgi:ferredoxin-nitrite reductase